MNYLLALFVFWVSCGICGGIVGGGRNSAGYGFLLGLFFGPLGVVAAFALDNRMVCAKCKQPHNTGAQVCPYCRSSLIPDDAELSQVERMREKRRRELGK